MGKCVPAPSTSPTVGWEQRRVFPPRRGNPPRGRLMVGESPPVRSPVTVGPTALHAKNRTLGLAGIEPNGPK